MSFVYNLLLVLHMLGLASLIGGWLVQMGARERAVNSAMMHGVYTQILTGIIMVGLAESVDSLDKDIANGKIGVKLLIAVVIAVLGFLNRKRTIPDGLYFLLGGLAVVNVVVAVFWT